MKLKVFQIIFYDDYSSISPSHFHLYLSTLKRFDFHSVVFFVASFVDEGIK